MSSNKYELIWKHSLELQTYSDRIDNYDAFNPNKNSIMLVQLVENIGYLIELSTFFASVHMEESNRATEVENSLNKCIELSEELSTMGNEVWSNNNIMQSFKKVKSICEGIKKMV